MTIPFKLIAFIMISLFPALFQGCSGHTLQDLIDGESNSKSSSEQSEQTIEKTHVVPPSQNRALNSISPSSTASDEHEEDRHMQKGTNEWLENEWKSLTESNTSTTKEGNSTPINDQKRRSIDDINSTGLQYYVDKAGIYMENKKKRDANKTKVPSHVEKINAMPGIGKSRKRR